jgi:nucleoside-diphosphate-sugar epimerase
LILGSDGYIGSNVYNYLVNHKVKVLGTSRKNVQGKIFFDICDHGSYKNIFNLLLNEDINFIINTVGAGVTPGVSEEKIIYETNVIATANFVEKLANYLTPDIKFLHLESSTQLFKTGKFESFYSETKYYGSEFLKAISKDQNLNLMQLYIHNVYGRNQPSKRFVSELVQSLTLSKEFLINHPERLRDFCFIDDVVESVIKCTNHDYGNNVFEIKSGVNTRLIDLAQTVCALLDKPRDLIKCPQELPVDEFSSVIHTAENSHVLECRTSLEEGLEKTIGEMQCIG